MSNGTPPPPPAAAPPPPPQHTPTQHTPPQPSYGGASANNAADSGFPLWAKIGLGCGCLVLIAGLVLFGILGYGAKKAIDFAQDFESNPSKAVEALIELNPELDVINNDSESGKITIRNNKTGEESTFDYSEVQQGRINFESDEGSYSLDANDTSGLTVTTPEGETRIGGNLDDVPKWVPQYPGAQADASGGMTMVQNDTASGLVAGRSADSLETIEAWFQEKLENEGFTLERNTINMNGTQQIMLKAKKEGIDQLAVALIREKSAKETQIAVTYEGPKD